MSELARPRKATQDAIAILVINCGSSSVKFALFAAAQSLSCRKLNPDVSVVQSAQNWHSQYATAWLDGARRRRVLVQ